MPPIGKKQINPNSRIGEYKEMDSDLLSKVIETGGLGRETREQSEERRNSVGDRGPSERKRRGCVDDGEVNERCDLNERNRAAQL